MSLTKESEVVGMKKISEIVALTLKEMTKHAKPGMTTKQLDNFGEQILNAETVMRMKTVKLLVVISLATCLSLTFGCLNSAKY